MAKMIKLSDRFLKTIERSPGSDRQYLGQPDMISLDDERNLLLVYPKGHGKGPIILQRSDDAGETWTEQFDLPNSWKNSLETPTLYCLRFVDGRKKLVLISGRPNWYQNELGGWDVSYSDDNGHHWTEFETIHPTIDGDVNWTYVAMSSLIQLKNKRGEWIDQWMAVYHNSDYQNFMTILSFDSQGVAQWSKPRLYLENYRLTEKKFQICEVGLFRSPDKNRIIGLARSQSHEHPSTIFYSNDEGKTWTEPKPAPLSLLGERHKIVYDSLSEKLVISFREIIFEFDDNGNLCKEKWMAGDWVAWIGTYDQLMNNSDDNAYRVLIAEDWTNSPKSGDTGYCGIVSLSDGSIVIVSYGHWDKEFSESWSYSVTTDLCYIKRAKFKLSDII